MLLFIASPLAAQRLPRLCAFRQMAIVGVFIGFVFIMDQPFKGQTAVDARPPKQAIVRMESRDR